MGGESGADRDRGTKCNFELPFACSRAGGHHDDGAVGIAKRQHVVAASRKREPPRAGLHKVTQMFEYEYSGL